jgi:hypothetical protein
MSTLPDYQHQVNSMTGAMGPMTSAYWAKVGAAEGNPAQLNMQPLMYNPVLGKYVNTFDQTASWTPWAVTGFGKKSRLNFKNSGKKYLRYNKKEMAKSRSKSMSKLSKFLKSLRKMTGMKRKVHHKKHRASKSKTSGRKRRSSSRSFGKNHRKHHKRSGSSRAFGKHGKKSRVGKKHGRSSRKHGYGIGQGRGDLQSFMGPF